MARINCLVDTDVLIDWLRGQSWAKEALWSGDKRLYCSSVTRKELLSKPGLSAGERERILRLLRHVRVLPSGYEHLPRVRDAILKDLARL